MIYVGIDPGQTGAIVALYGRRVVMCEPMPAASKVGLLLPDLADLIGRLVGEGAGRDGSGMQIPVYAIVERAQAFPGMGVSGAFGYGQGYGAILGVLAALGVPYETVRPGQWHGDLCGRRKSEGRPAAKARALQVVQQRLPDWTLARGKAKREAVVDAACLALWGQQCRRRETA